MKTPWHLWVIGVVSLLWNAVGAFDYLMTETKNATYMANFTPEQLDYFYSFPAWAVAFWALGVWFSVVGSILLLLRSRYALAAFLVSIVGMIGTSVYTYGFAETSMAEISGLGAMIFTAVIVLVGLASAWYAWKMISAQVLR